VLEEGMFRAARFGVRAQLPDADGRLGPVAELLDAALGHAGAHADELHCADALDRLPELLRRGGGAGRQRAMHEIGGMGALLRELTELTGTGLARSPR
jgi:carboxylate-amine ligase